MEKDCSVRRPLVRPLLPWSLLFGHFVRQHAICAQKVKFQVPTDLNSCIFSTGIILTSKQKWDFCVKSCNLVSWRIIIFASVQWLVCRAPGVVQLRFDGSEIVTMLNEFNQCLERKTNLICRCSCLRPQINIPSGKKSERKACVIMHVTCSSCRVMFGLLKPTAWIFWLC